MVQVRADAEAMRADNLALVERLKFVQASRGAGGRRGQLPQGAAVRQPLTVASVTCR